MWFFSRTKRDSAADSGRPEVTAGKPEALPPFKATPEALSQYLSLKTDEVLTQLKSVDGRSALYAKLMEHEAELQKIHAFNPAELERQLEVTGEALVAKEKFLKDVQSPEKQGMFRRAWEKVKHFPRKHPVVTALLLAALLAGGVAGGFYLTGNWELLLSSTGVNKLIQSWRATGQLVPPTPGTPPLPGGGVFDIPGGAAPPDLGIPT